MTENRTVILLDIDFTIFNTAAYKHQLFYRLGKELGFEREHEFDAIGQETINHVRDVVGHFDATEFLKQVTTRAKKPVSTSQLEQVIWDEDLYASVIYDDVITVLDQLSQKKDLTVGILSTGDVRLQEQKIKHLMSYFEQRHIHIFTNKINNLSDVLSKYPHDNVYIVDDTIDVLCAAKRIKPNVTAILIERPNRTGEPNPADTCEPDKKITELAELLKFI